MCYAAEPYIIVIDLLVINTFPYLTKMLIGRILRALNVKSVNHICFHLLGFFSIVFVLVYWHVVRPCTFVLYWLL
jgi:hypothetical protein